MQSAGGRTAKTTKGGTSHDIPPTKLNKLFLRNYLSILIYTEDSYLSLDHRLPHSPRWRLLIQAPSSVVSSDTPIDAASNDTISISITSAEGLIYAFLFIILKETHPTPPCEGGNCEIAL